MIAELEHLDRERYAGPVGWIDASGDGEWAIALRCGQISETDPRQIRLFAGCGIVAGSDPEAELAESNAKLIPMRDALGLRPVDRVSLDLGESPRSFWPAGNRGASVPTSWRRSWTVSGCWTGPSLRCRPR